VPEEYQENKTCSITSIIIFDHHCLAELSVLQKQAERQATSVAEPSTAANTLSSLLKSLWPCEMLLAVSKVCTQ